MDKRTRGQHTKEALSRALLDALAGKSPDQISVRELTEACHIRRQSFYYHFSGLEELLAWTFRRETRLSIERQQNMLTWEEGIVDLLRYVSQHHTVYRNILLSSCYRPLEQFFHDDLHALFTNLIGVFSHSMGYSIDPAYLSFLNECFCSLVIGLLENRLRNESPLSPEQELVFLERLISDQLQGILHHRLINTPKNDTNIQIFDS